MKSLNKQTKKDTHRTSREGREGSYQLGHWRVRAQVLGSGALIRPHPTAVTSQLAPR